MQRISWAAYAWPGLPDLWSRGQWLGLGLALFAGLHVNLLLASTFVWTEWLSSTARLALWCMLAFTWVVGVVNSRRCCSQANAIAAGGASQDLFLQAQSEYLRGNWFEAEVVVNRLIRQNARDVDAQLMLATLFRHTGRLEESSAQLMRLALFDDAQKWAMEIERERRLLETARESQLQGEDGAEESQPENMAVEAEEYVESPQLQRAA